MRWMSVCLALLLAGCLEPGEPEDPDGPDTPEVPRLDAAAELDLGTARVGSSVVGSLTVSNPGSSTVRLSAPRLDPGAFSLVQAPAVIEAGGSGELQVAFAPLDAITYTDSVTLNLVGGGALEIALRGAGARAALDGEESVQLEPATRGCASETVIGFLNVSDAPVQVSEVQVLPDDDGGALTLSAAASTLPGLVAPGASAWVTLRFAPQDALPGLGTLRLLTDDPVAPTMEVQVSGEVIGDAQAELILPVPSESLDLLVVVDDSSCSAVEQGLLSAALPPTLSSALLGVDWRLAVTTTSPSAAGVFRGDTPWVEPLDAGWADQVASRIEAGTAGSGDERGLDAALLALDEPNASGANAGFLRARTPLAVLLLSDEWDHSVLLPSYPDYAEALRAHKDDPEQVRAHDITGGASGCVGPGNEGGSSAGLGYTDVTAMTGGTSGSICAPDYSGFLESQLVGSLIPPQSVPLPDGAIPASISVALGGPVDWDSVEHSLVQGRVRLATPAAWGQAIRVRYDDAGLCLAGGPPPLP